MALSIKIQPTAGEVVYSRSPIVYRFEGCDPESEYKFSLYASQGTSPNVIYATIDRQIDLDLGITINASNLIKNYIKNNISFENDNLCYFKGYLEGFNSGGTSTGSITSDIAIATLGYVDDEDVYELEGSSVGFNIHKAGDHLMMNNETDVKYSIPNYGISPYYLTYKSNGSTIVDITYYNSTGQTTITTSTTSGISRIKCGYYDIYNYYGGTDINMKRPITVDFGSNTYILTPEECKYNDLHQVKFMNKYGVWELFYMDGKNEEETEIKFDEYKNNNIKTSTMTYDYMFGSYHKYNVVGRKKLMLNTGWIYDIKNNKIKDMLLSEYVFVDSMPYIITDTNVKYKTDKYDKIVNYTITFVKSFDIINNVI